MSLPAAEKPEGQEMIADSNHELDDQTSSENTSTFLPPINQVSEYIQLAKAGGHKGVYTCIVRNNCAW